MTKERGPELELPSATKHGSGNRAGCYYIIEFRSTSAMPKVVGDGRQPLPFIIDNYWRRLPVYRGATKWGVNIPVRSWDGDAADHGLLTYVAAEAHRWAFLSALEAGAAGAGGALCVETRLVEVQYQSSYSITEVGVTQPEGYRYKPDVEPRKIASADR